MSNLAWKPVLVADQSSFAEARRQAHNAAQWLVRVTHSFMPAASDNRHALLRWDAERAALVTREFLPNLTLELRLPELAMQFRERGQLAPHVFEFDDRTPAEAEAWALVELLHRRLDRDRFSKALPYEFPDLLTGDAVPYVVEPHRAALNELATCFTNASMLLGRVGEEHTAAAGGIPDIWCWPETFHLGMLLTLDDVDDRQALRVGWSPGDQTRGPHFYVSRHDASRPARVWMTTEFATSQDPAGSALDCVRAEIAKLRAQA